MSLPDAPPHNVGSAAPPPPLRLTLDADALTANWRALNRLSGAARAGAAVKADGYGTGARRVTQVLSAAGCRDFFVAYSAEAAELDGLVDPASIAVLHGALSKADAAFIKARGFRPVINSLHQARLWRDAGGGAADLMVDTGINRLGQPMADLGDPLLRELDLRVLHSHLASAEEDCPQNAAQRDAWQAARALGLAPEASLANSAGIVLGEDYHGDLTRPGLALYGGVPCAALVPHIQQVVRPEVALMQVRDLAAGDAVGYNATFVAQRAMRVGVAAVGYGDGYLRAWSGKGSFRHGGQVLPVLGRISMDMTVLDLTAAAHLGEGDWVEIDYALPDAAKHTGLSQYELLTLLGRRFSRTA